MKRYLWMFLVAVAAMALLTAACGGGDDDDTGTGSDPTNTPADSGGDPTNTPADSGNSGGDPTSTPADSGNDGDADTGLSAVMAAASALSDANSYKVKYQITSEGGPEGAIDGTFTIASDPPRQAILIEGTFGNVESTMMLISDEDSNIICVKAEAPAACIKTGSGGTSPIPLPTFFNAPDLIGSFTTADGVKVEPAGSDTVAGQSAKCYDVTSPEGDAKVCVADDGGQLLSVDVTEGTMKFRLVVLESGDSSDADFEPIADVQSFGSGG